jgi:uncharacterized membrane protein YbhN (UPF0104 family)
VSRLRTAVRAGFGALAVGGLAYATATQWSRVGDAIRLVSAPDLALAGAATLGGTYASFLAWRAVLADLGSPLPVRDAAKVFFVGQLGKYVPGSLWTVVAQMELGRDRDVPRRRSAAAALLVIVVALTAAGVVAAATLPFTAGGGIKPYRYVFLAPAVGLVLLVPKVFERVVSTAFRLVKRTPPERMLSERGVLAALGWAAVQWLLYGVAVWALARAVPGAPGTLLALATGAYALAWSAGFLFLVAPAGAGVREGALTLLLAPAVGSGRALGFALVTRLLATLADLILGAVAVVTGGTSGQDVRGTGRPNV